MCTVVGYCCIYQNMPGICKPSDGHSVGLLMFTESVKVSFRYIGLPFVIVLVIIIIQ